VPPGEYLLRVLRGELTTSRSGTPGYKLTLEVAEGDLAGRRVWHEVWLTEAALPMAKRDLGKLGITQLPQLEQPLPEGIIIRAKVALRKGDDGSEHNRLTRFELERVEGPDPFAPGHDNGEVQS
jgi:hypothetical protein